MNLGEGWGLQGLITPSSPQPSTQTGLFMLAVRVGHQVLQDINQECRVGQCVCVCVCDNSDVGTHVFTSHTGTLSMSFHLNLLPALKE